MKVALLGTSGAEGWPGLFCRCEACGKARELRGKNLRTRSSALIDGVLKIDFPPDILTQVIQNNLDLRCMKALLFTHAHDDHFSGAELQYRGEHFVPTPIEEYLPVFGPQEVIKELSCRYEPGSLPLTWKSLRLWQTVLIEGYQITPLEAQHDHSQECFNYIIQDSEGATLLYASDTGWYEEETWEFLADFTLDGIVVECAKGPVEGGYRGHLCIPEVLQMRQKLIAMGCFLPKNPMVTTHFSHLGGLMHDELEALLNPHNVQVGYDGMVFSVEG